ncbi:sulfonate ABC transporter substrate-binding protein [Aureimonas endophytica]|uniref:Putative aliphatic sulfonates-binding protein n=1 Tax=Aureimonas endophytica TaxID=2027858 RepID=A0A916ZTI8_9HYPH|nr:sulfonate ABC transporter substrate-binding protein [Aureimonas endophytica]GGE12459.1 sulfonate ABC transporter substrate-binding protein [Aureimonas endophytica]
MRYDFLRRALAAAALLASLAAAASAGAAERTVHIGFQKYGTLVLLKGRGTLEEKLKPLGYDVQWAEFPGGPQLLEALNVGAVDFGSTGETPPIFAQAAGAPLVYVAHEPPAPKGEAILVPKDSPIRSVAELKGRKVALNKGSNVHYLLVRALEDAGLAYGDIQPVFLAPADARAAFESGAVDAWVIWDPFQAAAEVTSEAREIRNGEGLVPNHQFYLGTKSFVAENKSAVEALLAAIAETDAWVAANTQAAADTLSPSVGIPADILKVALDRQSYGAKPLDEETARTQQKIADTFHALGLIPAAIKVEDALHHPQP